MAMVPVKECRMPTFTGSTLVVQAAVVISASAITAANAAAEGNRLWVVFSVRVNIAVFLL